jgi:hypothetical protein
VVGRTAAGGERVRRGHDKGTQTTVPGGSSPYDEASELLQGDDKATSARVPYGGATRVDGGADLGFWASEGSARVWGFVEAAAHK